MNKNKPDKHVSFETVLWWLLICSVAGFIGGMIIMSGFV